MRKAALLLFLVVCIASGCCLWVYSAEASPSSGVGLVEFAESYMYWYQSFGGEVVSTYYLPVFVSSNGTLSVSTTGGYCTVDSSSLEVQQVVTTAMDLAKAQTADDVYSLCAFVSALEYSMTARDLFALQGTSALLESNKIVNKILDGVDISTLISGKAIVCYQGDKYTYTLRHSPPEDHSSGTYGFVALLADKRVSSVGSADSSESADIVPSSAVQYSDATVKDVAGRHFEPGSVSVVRYTPETKRVLISATGRNGATMRAIQYGMWESMRDTLRDLRDMDVGTITFSILFSSANLFGDEAKRVVMKAEFPRDMRAPTDWDEIELGDIPVIATNYWEHNAFSK